MEIDIGLVKDKAVNKTFVFTDDDGVYDFTDSTVILRLYKETPVEIDCTFDLATGTVTVPFTTAHTDTLGLFEYVIEETKADTSVIPLVKGNIEILDYVPFSQNIEAFLASELPSNLTLTSNYRNQRIMYWRLFLQSAFDIPDEDLNTESAWPTLVNILFAKLVVYDAMMLAATGSFIHFLGGSYTSTSTLSGNTKSVETGPTKVEYYDISSSAKNALTSSGGGVSMLDVLKSSICGLSNKLRVKLPMCDAKNKVISPKYYQNPDWDYVKLSEMDDFIETTPSQG